MTEPLMEGKPLTNVFTEHVFKIRATFGASSAVTFRSKDATIAKTDTAKWTITLPKAYAEITEFSAGRKAAVSVAGLEFIIVTDNVATDGTLVVQSIASNGTATEPASGNVTYFTIGVSCDVLNSKFTG